MQLFSEEHEMIANTARQIVENEVPPEKAREIDENDRYPREIIGKLAELELTGLTIEEQYEGAGRDIIGACLVTEELARRSIALAWVYVDSVFFGGEYISQLGSEEQRKEYLPRLAQGEILFCYALTEPDAGSDLSALKTTAEAHGDKFVINGTKTFISGASQCDYMLLLARTDKSQPRNKGLSFFVIDLKSPGIFTRPIPKLGVHGSDTCELTLADVCVPANCILGGPEQINQGWKQLMSTLKIEHLHVAAEAVGLAGGVLELTLSYVKEREQFGQPVGKFQSIQHQLADLATEIQAARLLTYYSAGMVQQNKLVSKESAMAKLYATETAKKMSLLGMQYHGGYGYAMEYDIQRFVRDALVLTIGGGTSEIQRNVIARTLGL